MNKVPHAALLDVLAREFNPNNSVAPARQTEATQTTGRAVEDASPV